MRDDQRVMTDGPAKHHRCPHPGLECFDEAAMVPADRPYPPHRRSRAGVLCRFSPGAPDPNDHRRSNRGVFHMGHWKRSGEFAARGPPDGQKKRGLRVFWQVPSTWWVVLQWCGISTRAIAQACITHAMDSSSCVLDRGRQLRSSSS